MKIQIKTLAAMALALMSSGTAAASADTLVIVRNGGLSLEKVVMSERPTVSYVTTEEGCGVSVETSAGGFRAVYPLGDVKRLYFIPAIPAVDATSSGVSQTLTFDFSGNTAIKAAETSGNDVLVSFTNGSLFRVRGLSGHPSVSVFSMDGRAARANVSISDGEVDVDLSALQRGYYVIKINNQPYKIFKR